MTHIMHGSGKSFCIAYDSVVANGQHPRYGSSTTAVTADVYAEVWNAGCMFLLCLFTNKT